MNENEKDKYDFYKQKKQALKLVEKLNSVLGYYPEE